MPQNYSMIALLFAHLAHVHTTDVYPHRPAVPQPALDHIWQTCLHVFSRVCVECADGQQVRHTAPAFVDQPLEAFRMPMA